MAEGDIGAVIDSFEFNPDRGYDPHILHISGDVYAIVYSGPASHCIVATYSISGDGDIGASSIDHWDFYPALCGYPFLVHVSGDVFAVFLAVANEKGHIFTLTIATDGTITKSLIDHDYFDGSTVGYIRALHVSSNIFAVVYVNWHSEIYVTTCKISVLGYITTPIIDSVSFEPVSSYYPFIIHISGNVYLIAYACDVGHGKARTITIDASGDINPVVVDTLNFDSAGCSYITMVHVSGEIYAIAYAGASGNGTLKTFSVTDAGDIGAAIIDSFVYLSGSYGTAVIIHVSGDVYAICYYGVYQNGWLQTISISDAGDIAAAAIDTFQFSTSYNITYSFLHVSGDVYAVAYPDGDADGQLKTIGIGTVVPAGTQHELLMGIG